MAKKAKDDLPGRSVLLKLAKEIELKNNHENSREVRAAEIAVKKRYIALLKDAKFRSLERAESAAKKRSRDKVNKWNQARSNLIRRIQLEPITPTLVREVRRMLGIMAKPER